MKYSEHENETDFRFYYCDSTDEYLLGKRVDNFYYAKWDNTANFVWTRSKYLPWGKVRDGFVYPSEPKEIDVNDWFKGFLKTYELLENEAVK